MKVIAPALHFIQLLEAETRNSTDGFGVDCILFGISEDIGLSLERPLIQWEIIIFSHKKMQLLWQRWSFSGRHHERVLVDTLFSALCNRFCGHWGTIVSGRWLAVLRATEVVAGVWLGHLVAAWVVVAGKGLRDLGEELLELLLFAKYLPFLTILSFFGFWLLLQFEGYSWLTLHSFGLGARSRGASAAGLGLDEVRHILAFINQLTENIGRVDQLLLLYTLWLTCGAVSLSIFLTGLRRLWLIYWCSEVFHVVVEAAFHNLLFSQLKELLRLLSFFEFDQRWISFCLAIETVWFWLDFAKIDPLKRPSLSSIKHKLTLWIHSLLLLFRTCLLKPPLCHPLNPSPHLPNLTASQEHRLVGTGARRRLAGSAARARWPRWVVDVAEMGAAGLLRKRIGLEWEGMDCGQKYLSKLLI